MAERQIKTLRIVPGSALERLVAGRNFTACIHELAEHYVRNTLRGIIPPPPVVQREDLSDLI